MCCAELATAGCGGTEHGDEEQGGRRGGGCSPPGQLGLQPGLGRSPCRCPVVLTEVNPKPQAGWHPLLPSSAPPLLGVLGKKAGNPFGPSRNSTRGDRSFHQSPLRTRKQRMGHAWRESERVICLSREAVWRMEGHRASPGGGAPRG